MSKLKYPLELLIYPRESSGKGIYSLAKLDNDEISAVIYHYETETWELLPNHWIKNIVKADAVTVPEEILHLNGLGSLIGKKFEKI